MWRILFADDESSFHLSVKKDIIESYFSKEMAIIDSVDYAFSDYKSIPSANKLLNESKFHIAFIDSYFANENTVEINGKEYKAKILGEALIQKYKINEYPLHYFFLTAYRDLYKDIDAVYNTFYFEPKVSTFSKANINQEDWKNELIKSISTKLKELAIILVNKIHASKKQEVLLRAYQQQVSRLDKLTIENEEWTIGNLCAGWWDNGSRKFTEDINIIVKKILIPDLTLAVSECFGIEGYKSVTHDLEQGYFIGDWQSNLNVKLISLEQQINTVAEPINVLKPYLREIIEFKSQINLIKDQNQAKEIINSFKNFRIGTSPNALRKLKIAGKEISPNLCLSGKSFEVYLPIDEFFQTQFSRLSEKTNFLGCFSYNTNVKINRDKISWKENKTPVLFNEYLIFFQTGMDYHEGFPIPGVIDSFTTGYFQYFGKIYLYVRQTGVWFLYDLTWEKTLIEEQVFPESLLSILAEHKKDANSFIVFEFSGWRQPN